MTGHRIEQGYQRVYHLDLLLDIEAAAVEAGIGQSTIRRWIRQGLLVSNHGTVLSSDVRRVKAEKQTARLANLKQHRVSSAA